MFRDAAGILVKKTVGGLKKLWDCCFPWTYGTTLGRRWLAWTSWGSVEGGMVCVLGGGLAKQKEKPRYKDIFSSQRMAGCCCCLNGVVGGGDLHGVGGGNMM